MYSGGAGSPAPAHPSGTPEPLAFDAEEHDELEWFKPEMWSRLIALHPGNTGGSQYSMYSLIEATYLVTSLEVFKKYLLYYAQLLSRKQFKYFLKRFQSPKLITSDLRIHLNKLSH